MCEADIMLPYDKRLLPRARVLRAGMTPAENMLWSKINKKQLGYWIYRQKPIGIFIADFYCHHSKLVIELDGGHHQIKENKKYDRERTEHFTTIGLQTIRFTNKEVLANINGVLQKIRKLL